VVAVSAGAFVYLNSASDPRAPESVVQTPVQTPLVIASAPTDAPPEPGTLFRDCPTCPLMTAVPTGEFLQGSSADTSGAQSFEFPQHRVRIAKPFAASRTEISVGEFAEFAQATGHDTQGCMTYDGEWKLSADVRWKNALTQQTSAHPVSCISWQDATAYARWLSERTGQSYRLPSASEWEYAARAGSTAERAWTVDADACAAGNLADQGAAQRYPGWAVLNCNDAYVQAAPVGSFAANAFGLHDMLGNVFEWVADCWSDNYQGAPTDGRANRDGDCSQRELRGGSWFTAPSFVRFAYRNRFASDYRSSSVGFRLVREIAP
jgi:formylglycine-generating enzyme required for sulfatase activity